MAKLGQWELFDRMIPPERTTLKFVSLVEANKGTGHIEQEKTDEEDR